MANAVSHKATKWEGMDHHTGQMYAFCIKRLWHGWLRLRVLWEKAGHLSMAGLAVSAQEGSDSQTLIFKVRKFTSDFLDCLATDVGYMNYPELENT